MKIHPDLKTGTSQAKRFEADTRRSRSVKHVAGPQNLARSYGVSPNSLFGRQLFGRPLLNSIKTTSAYFLVIVLSVLALASTHNLWNADLSKPLRDFSSDGILATYLAKALGENALLHNNRVGAPFGLDYYDFFQPDFFHQSILKLIEMIAGEPVRAINIYFLGSFVVIACTAFFVFRRFRFSTPVACVCAILYAFTPSHLLRSYYHIFLSAYYLIPLTVLVALMIMQKDETTEAVPVNSEGLAVVTSTSLWRSRFPYCALLLSFCAAGSGVYYAAYSMLFIGIAGIYSAAWSKRKDLAGLAFACVALIGVTVTAALIPTARYHAKFGANPYVAHRSVGQADVLSLKIAHLLLPMPQHRIERLRRISAEYNDDFPALHGNESQIASLGFAGAVGFIMLIYWLLVGRMRDMGDDLLHRLSILNIAGVLFATTAGFGSLVSLLITPQLRAHNRLSLFIAFFAMSAFGTLLEKLRRLLPLMQGVQIGFYAFSATVLILGLYDQSSPQLDAAEVQRRSSFDFDRRFIEQVEASLPLGANVLQLPFQSFPESGPVYQLGDYDHLRAYIHSKTLNWSYPVMKGRPGEDWLRELSSKPASELVRLAVLGGFSGIYIDRRGFPDSAAALESELRGVIEAVPIVSYDARLSFFSLTTYDAKRQAIMTPEERLRRMAVDGVSRLVPTFSSGVYGLETDAGRAWRWASQKGEIGILNMTNKERHVRLSMQLFSGFPERSVLFLRTTNESLEATMTAAGDPFQWNITLKPGMNRIDFHTNANRIATTASDTRALYFRMEHFQLDE
jgi:phosphoglycerol transferase